MSKIKEANQKKVEDYFSSIGSRLSYDIILWGAKHLGYYPSGKADISEKEAQLLLQDLVAKNLDMKEGQVILDAGCGQGVVSTYLAKKYGPKIFGITITGFEIDKAKKRAKDEGVEDKTEYKLMDYSATTFSDNYFDGVYTTETLSHSPDIRQTLKEFYRVLKPGGKFAFFEYTLAPDDKMSPEERKMSYLSMEGTAMMGLKDFRHDEFPKILEECGFENATQQNISKNMLPSFYRVYKILYIPYMLGKFLGLQKFFINATAVCEFYKMADKGLARYCIFTGNKPL